MQCGHTYRSQFSAAQTGAGPGLASGSDSKDNMGLVGHFCGEQQPNLCLPDQPCLASRTYGALHVDLLSQPWAEQPKNGDCEGFSPMALPG